VKDGNEQQQQQQPLTASRPTSNACAVPMHFTYCASNTILTTVRSNPGGGETIWPPPMVVRRWQKSWRVTSVCGRVRSPYISAGRRWLSCRQPACLQPRQLCHGTDRRADRAISKCPLPGRGHNKAVVHCSLVVSCAQYVQHVTVVVRPRSTPAPLARWTRLFSAPAVV